MSSVRYYPLINKLINAFDIREKLSFSTNENEIRFDRPYITIAREPGSGGRPIAQMVAKKLGYTFIDEIIIDELAKSIKKRKEVIQAIDEKSRTWIGNMVHSILNEEYVDDIEYMTELVKIIIAHALKGNVVIVGRGANFITPFQHGLHVNITAPKKVRIDRAMEFEGIDKKKAQEVISKTEKERKDFVKQYFGFDINKVNSYDLSINTTHYSLPQARDIIIQAYKAKFTKKFLVPFVSNM